MNILEYENYQEKKDHGLANFPYNTYLCTIPLDFPNVQTHWHEEFEIIYIKKGTGEVTIDFKTYVVQSDTLLFILPGQIHSISQFKNETMEYENILFQLTMLLPKKQDRASLNFFLPLLNDTLELPTILTSQHEHYKEVVSYIDASDTICKTFPYGYELAIKGNYYLLFYTLFSKCSKKVSVKKDAKTTKKIREIITYIENHYFEKITIEDMAKVLDYSPSHFMKFFKQAMGTTFIDYLNDYRLTMAARLLTTIDASILDIAYDTGFDNISYFNRRFKKKYEMTPREYQKRILGK